MTGEEDAVVREGTSVTSNKETTEPRFWEEGFKKREDLCKGPEAGTTLEVSMERKEEMLQHPERAGRDEGGHGGSQEPLQVLGRR